MKWSKKQPTEPGYYWFYGDPFSDKIYNKYIRVYLVQAHRNGSGTISFVTEGHFMENKIGFWTPAHIPEFNEEDVE